MGYDREMLLSIVKNVRTGDVVKIRTCFEVTKEDHYNTILIINDSGSLKAVWYDGEYKGLPYVILDYQIILEIVKRDVNLKSFFKEVNKAGKNVHSKNQNRIKYNRI